MRAGALVRGLLAAALCAGGGVTAAHAQQTGRVAGTVTDAATGQPLAGAQVSIAGTQIRAITNEQGSYALANVPAGTVQVQATMIGYSMATGSGTVADGGTATVNLSLQTATLLLDQLVVTGTAGAARRREVGNSISQIEVSTASEPAASTEQLIQGNAPGVTIMESSGQVGAGRQIRLRGSVSVAMSSSPLIYVDGVRVRSDPYPVSKFPEERIDGSGSGSNSVATALNDIDPNDIERIEVIKGAAATTLYGTEAAAGVVQIFTKRGNAGAPQWTLQVDQTVSDYVQGFGTEDEPYLGLDRWMSLGRGQIYSLQVGGGTDDLRYFVSGTYENTDGIFPDDHLNGWGVRGNFTFTPAKDLHLDWTTSISSKDLQNVPMGNNATGLALNVYRSPSNYIGSADPADIDRLLEQEWTTDINHVISGLTANYQQSSWLRHRFTLGYDRAANDMIGNYPYGFLTDPLGRRHDTQFLNETVTVDYVGTGTFQPRDDFSATFSLGGQGVTTDEVTLIGYSRDFPGPGESTVSSGAIYQAIEERIRVINAGLFAQALLGYRDRYFLTLGLRADGNSAFGENLGVEYYPKVSGAYVISEESFWPQALGQWKLRAAYGHAGRAPGAFDAVRTWQPVAWVGQPAFFPNTVGNPDLGPERTAELELGFDAVLLNERMTVDFTYYNSTTTDALLPVLQTPSLGFGGTQLMNVGEIHNSGLEVAANAQVLQREGLDWDLGLTLAHNRNEVADLGGAASYSIGDNGFVMEGEPAPVIVGTYLANPGEYAEPVVESNHVFGPNLPVNTVGLNTSLTFGGGIELSARAEYMGGHYIYDRASRNMATRRVWPGCEGEEGGYALIEAGRRDELTAFERYVCGSPAPASTFFNFPADFMKLRSVSLRVPVPERLLMGSRSASITAAVRNIMLWHHSDLPLFEPEMAGQNGAASAVRAIVEQVPAPTTFTLSLRVGF